VLAEDPASLGEPLADHFVGRGLCVFRTGWKKDAVMFSTEAGPFYPVTHNQADKGHFTLYGLGHRWAIDSGYGNNRKPGGRDQTVAHNCVLIDGKGQALSGAGAGTNGRIASYDNNRDYGYAVCDATEAYNTNSKGQLGATVMHALRHCLFMRPYADVPAYAVVLDDIEKDDATHEFTWLLHTDEHNTVKVGEARVTIVPSPMHVVREGEAVPPRMELFMHANRPIRFETDTYERHPRLRAITRATKPEFAAVMLPLPATIPVPDVRFDVRDNGLRITVEWTKQTDEIVWPTEGKRVPIIRRRN
jgi:hypothetical protein